MRYLCLCGFLLAAACADLRYFAPRENRNGTSPEGYPAAVYPVVAGDAAGEVRLWTTGSRRVERDGAEAVELRIGFEIENTGQVPLELSAITCSGPGLGANGSDEAAMVALRGETRAAPGKTAGAELVFLPAVARARDIERFAVRFTVLSGDRTLLVQETPFAPWSVRSSDPYDRPMYWPYMGFGFGLHAGWHHHWH